MLEVSCKSSAWLMVCGMCSRLVLEAGSSILPSRRDVSGGEIPDVCFERFKH